MKVETKIRVYEVDGREDKAPMDDEGLTLESHWNRNGHGGLVILKRGKMNITVAASDLEEAAKRCVGLPR